MVLSVLSLRLVFPYYVCFVCVGKVKLFKLKKNLKNITFRSHFVIFATSGNVIRQFLFISKLQDKGFGIKEIKEKYFISYAK